MTKPLDAWTAPIEPHVRQAIEKMDDYQQEAIVRAATRKRLLLGDEMGLGKTSQALLACELADTFPVIVVTPASVKQTWMAETKKWVPWRKASIANGIVEKSDIVILNAESLGKHIVALKALAPKAVILDESHYFKNHEAKRSRLAQSLVARIPMRLLLTGTPVKNRRPDLAHQLRILGALDEVLQQHEDYAMYAASGTDMDSHKMAHTLIRTMDPQRLHEALLATVLVRRTVDEVHKDAAELVRRQDELTAEKTPMYLKAEANLIAWAKGASERDMTQAKERNRMGIEIGAHINALRQAAAFAKIPRAVEWATQVKAQGRRGVLFTYHRAIADELQKTLPGKTVKIHGDVPIPKRHPIVLDFANSDFLVATMDTLAHGVDGIQHHADAVAFVELDYTPTKHQQSEGRVRRRGQKSARVESTFIVLRDSADEAIMDTLDEKWRDNEQVLDGKVVADENRFMQAMAKRIVGQRPWETGRIAWSERRGPRTHFEQAEGGPRALRSTNELPLGLGATFGDVTVAFAEPRPTGWVAKVRKQGYLISLVSDEYGTYLAPDNGSYARAYLGTFPLDGKVSELARTMPNKPRGTAEGAAWLLDQIVRGFMAQSDDRAMCLHKTVVAERVGTQWGRTVLDEPLTRELARKIRRDAPGCVILNDYYPNQAESATVGEGNYVVGKRYRHNHAGREARLCKLEAVDGRFGMVVFDGRTVRTRVLLDQLQEA